MAIKRIRESEEMYLETILLLRGKKAEVHSIDVAEELGYVKSSVSRGVNLLKARGYIEIAPSGAITFTKAGKEKAEGIYERHERKRGAEHRQRPGRIGQKPVPPRKAQKLFQVISFLHTSNLLLLFSS